MTSEERAAAVDAYVQWEFDLEREFREAVRAQEQALIDAIWSRGPAQILDQFGRPIWQDEQNLDGLLHWVP